MIEGVAAWLVRRGWSERSANAVAMIGAMVIIIVLFGFSFTIIIGG